MSAYTELDDEKVKDKIKAKGVTPVAVEHLPFWFERKYFVMCYIVQVKESPRRFIVRGDSGEVFESGDFWEKFGPASTALSGPFIIVKYEF